MIVLDHLDDPLLDPDFKPCRDERCAELTLHAEHNVPVGRGRQPRLCPICNSKIIRVPRKWASCSNCSWRINNQTKDTDRA